MTNMAKKASKTLKTTPTAPDIAPPTGESVQTVTTIHGEVVPLADVAHIAEHLRTLAFPTEVLVRDPENARKHGKTDLAATAASLKRFGMQAAIHFDPQSKVIKIGNGRHEAAQSILEWKYVAALPWAGTREELRAFALVDNRTAELSEWDPARLAAELDAIRDDQELLGDLGALPSIEAMGFDDDALADLAEDRESKTKRKQSSAEAKDKAGGGGGPTQHIVQITCGSERHQTQVLQAVLDNDVKALLKLLHGVDVRAKAN